MDSDLSWWPIGRLDLILRSAPIIFDKIHVNVDMIWQKILFEVLLFSELCCNPANMAAKCRCILLQKDFELSMTDGLGNHFHFLDVLPLYTTSTFFQISYVKSTCFILPIIDEIFWWLISDDFDKFFWVCWNAFVFSKHFQLQSVILMLFVQTSSSICKVCNYNVFRSHSSERCEWTRHVSMLRYQLLMKIA